MLDLQVLDGRENHRRNEVHTVVDPCGKLDRVQKRGARRTHQAGGLAGDEPPVRQLDCCGRRARLGSLGPRGGDGSAHGHVQMQRVHEHFLLAQLFGHGDALFDGAGGGEITPDDLLIRRFAAGIIVADGKARHVDAHIRRAFIRALAEDGAEDRFEHREDLDVAVIIDRCFAVGLKVEGVDHVDVGQIGCRGLVGEVDRVLERQVPDRERLIFGVARVHAALVLLIELAEAGRHLAGAGAGGRDNDDGAAGFDILVSAVALIGNDEIDIRRIIRDGIVPVDLHAQRLQLALERLGGLLARVLRDDDAADIEPDGAERVDQAHDVQIVGDAEIAPALVHFNVGCVDGNDDLRLLLELQQHLHLAVRLEAGQDARGVIVVKKLAAEFQIELAAEMRDALQDPFGLQLQILLIVKSNFHKSFPVQRMAEVSADFVLHFTSYIINRNRKLCNHQTEKHENFPRPRTLGRPPYILRALRQTLTLE